MRSRVGSAEPMVQNRMPNNAGLDHKKFLGRLNPYATLSAISLRASSIRSLEIKRNIFEFSVNTKSSENLYIFFKLSTKIFHNGLVLLFY